MNFHGPWSTKRGTKSIRVNVSVTQQAKFFQVLIGDSNAIDARTNSKGPQGQGTGGR